MNHDTIVGQVQHRARLASRGDAERAIRATLETLAVRIDPGLANNLADQLPPEIGRDLRTLEAFERIPVDEFYEQVAIREGVDIANAAFHARAVMSILGKGVSRSLIDHLRNSLPADYANLFLLEDEDSKAEFDEFEEEQETERTGAGVDGQ
jgi:uncharacterized protein (DUF2267 family)